MKQLKKEDQKKDRYMKISLKLLTMMRESLAKFLKKNVDLLAWKPEDMPCIKQCGLGS